MAVASGYRHALQPAGNGPDQPHEDPPLQDFDHVDLQGDQQIEDRQTADQHQHQDDQRLDKHAERNRIDQRLYRDRRGQRHQARAHGEGHHRPEIAALQPDQTAQVHVVAGSGMCGHAGVVLV